MKALLKPGSTDSLPTVKSWLRNGHAALTVTDSIGGPEQDPMERLHRLTEENVLMQLAHLKTHPCVAGAVARDQLTISGWVYEIGTGEIRIAEDGHRDFIPVAEADSVSA